MASPDDVLVAVTAVPTELEGQLLVNVLKENGIPAVATGGYTAQFRAEAPGEVRVLVNQENLAAAQAVLAKGQPRDAE